MFDPPLNKVMKDVEKDIDTQSEKIFRGVALDLFGRIIKKTPVDTGAARGAWQASIGSPVLSGGGANGNRAGVYLPPNKNLLPYYLSNPLPYVQVLEFGGYGTGPGATVKTTRDGYSTQAPTGMIRLSIREMGLK